MRLTPKSTFAQTAILIGALLLLNQLVSYLSVTYYFINPSYNQINELVTKQIKSLLITGKDTLSDEQKALLHQQTGISFHDETSAMHAGLSLASFNNFMSAEVSKNLGQEVEIRLFLDESYLIWVKPYRDNEFYISIPLQAQHRADVSPLSMYFTIIGILSVLGGWLFVRRLNRPLQRLQKAAIDVGDGKFPEPLPLEGSSEIIAVTQAFNKMSLNVKQLEADRNLMTAGISHDLRTPLTRIRLSSEMLPSEHEWIKEGIEHDIEDMNAIIDQFIEYARIDNEEVLSYLDINELIEALAQQYKYHERYQIQLSLEDIPQVKAKRIGIKRVLDNLVENAFRYGSPKITIYTAYSVRKKALLIGVRDYGPGIPKERLPSLFNPFQQGDKARGTQGSGLGLAIIKRIVESHGGEINFTNHPEGGLNAEFSLPYFVKQQTKNKR